MEHPKRIIPHFMNDTQLALWHESILRKNWTVLAATQYTFKWLTNYYNTELITACTFCFVSFTFIFSSKVLFSLLLLFFFLRNDLITVTHSHLQTATGSSTPAFGVKGSSVAVMSTTEQVYGWKWKISQYQYSSSFGSLLKCIHSNSCLSLVIWSFLLSQHSIG